MNLLIEKNVERKISRIEQECHQVLLGESFEIPQMPGRDVEVMSLRGEKVKKELFSPEGQARLLHNLGSIELQAMELAFRSLIEYPEAPQEFREEMASLAISEASHLKACVRGLENLGFPWGTWPVHMALWAAVDSSDTILDRLLIVHRYLEGSGLDAGEKFLARLKGLPHSVTHEVVNLIVTEEVGHVQFGNRWYKRFCEEHLLDADHDFKERFVKLEHRLPRRIEKICEELRLKSGFTLSEVEFLKEQREKMLL